MSHSETAPLVRELPNRLVAGVVGGLAGGVVFGVLMQTMDMMPMVAQLVGSESIVVGWLVHLFNSALFGAIFTVVFARWLPKPVPAVVLGMAYGVVWWVLGALLIMPAWLGMNEMIFELTTTAWQSLMGHLVYGLLLGLVSTLVIQRWARR